MASKLLDRIPQSNNVKWSSSAQNIWADHYTYLSTFGKITRLQISKFLCGKYAGDYYGILQELGIESAFHPFVLMFNGYSHPCDYKGDVEYIDVPDTGEMSRILQVNSTVTI